MSWQLSNKAYDDTGDYLRHFSYMFNRYSQDWNVNYFYDGNQRGGQQRYPSMRSSLEGLIAKAAPLDTHRKHRERVPPPGMMQPASTTLCSLSLRIERSAVFRKCGMLSKSEPLLGGICRPGKPLRVNVKGRR
ncbi:MAG: hypothetical protein D4R93_04770 [Deltaproteobacteria bacterium]|nr:MAG: hypothetical protein D4R93_04770 [Deltaproteobacteria bacterium]